MKSPVDRVVIAALTRADALCAAAGRVTDDDAEQLLDDLLQLRADIWFAMLINSDESLTPEARRLAIVDLLTPRGSAQ